VPQWVTAQVLLIGKQIYQRVRPLSRSDRHFQAQCGVGIFCSLGKLSVKKGARTFSNGVNPKKYEQGDVWHYELRWEWLNECLFGHENHSNVRSREK
jgi:hypothetical protein